MGPWDDLHGEMPRNPLDDGTVEALLGGAVSPDDAPPELRHVAALVEVCRRGAEGDELRGAEQSVAGFAAAAVHVTGCPDDLRRRSMLKKLTSARVLAIAAPVALLGAGTAAAAADALPAPAQAAASSALAHLDVSVPNPNDQGPGHGVPTNTSKGKGPDASSTGHATFGLCTAFTAGGLSDHSVAYRNLYNAAPGHDIASYCSTVIGAHQSAVNGGANDNGTGTGPTGGNNNQPSGTEGSGSTGPDTNTGGAPFTTPPVNPPKGKPSTTPPSGVPPSHP